MDARLFRIASGEMVRVECGYWLYQEWFEAMVYSYLS
jgi:hypothetical protein